MAGLDKYAEEGEGYRIVLTELGSKFKIIRQPDGTFWKIEVDTGMVPVALRGRYTNHKNAFVDIKNYIDNHKERQIVYKKLPKKEEAA